MKDTISLKSYAKINLTLNIVGPRGDGYHEINSIMQSISLSDIIHIKKTEKDIRVLCENPNVPDDEDNICYKAVKVFGSIFELPGGLEIKIEKNIPVTAGLAGGSGNAAATLYGLNLLFDAKITPVKLEAASAEIGSDVPFCLTGGRAQVMGRGDVVVPLPKMAEVWLVLVKPPFEIPVKLAYDEFDKLWAKRSRQGIASMTTSLSPTPSAVLHNDLEEGIFLKHPLLKEIKEKMIKHGLVAAAMSGSGPTVFGIARDKKDAERIFAQLRGIYPEVYIAQTVNKGVEVI